MKIISLSAIICRIIYIYICAAALSPSRHTGVRKYKIKQHYKQLIDCYQSMQSPLTKNQHVEMSPKGKLRNCFGRDYSYKLTETYYIPEEINRSHKWLNLASCSDRFGVYLHIRYTHQRNSSLQRNFCH